MSKTVMTAAVPILASLDIAATVAFYTKALGFTCRYESPGEYAIIQRDDIEIHFWPCDNADIAANTACRVRVLGIAALHDEYKKRGVLRPDCELRETPWGSHEFEIFDPHNNLVTFFEDIPDTVQGAS